MVTTDELIKAAKEIERAREAVRIQGGNASQTDLDRIRAAEKKYDKLKKRAK